MIDGPAIISFSGGRSSGMMLKLILDHFGGTLPDDIYVAFANTGKEMPQTLDFVNDCSKHWDVPITWLEHQTHEEPQKRWRTVTYETASRNGEPFEAVIKAKSYLPNPVARFCTIEMKIRPMKLWCQQILGWKHWDIAIGFRADESRRVAKLSIPNTEVYERVAPLAKLGISKTDVSDFWRHQGFDLNLPNNNGVTDHGNCDLCFLKGIGKTYSLVSEDPSRAVWWAEQEEKIGATFRKDRISYRRIHDLVIAEQPVLFDFDNTLDDCGCTD